MIAKLLDAVPGVEREYDKDGNEVLRVNRLIDSGGGCMEAARAARAARDERLQQLVEDGQESEE